MIRVETLTGQALDAALDAVAGLRIRVFRAYPYLYDGDMDYERRYVASYRNSARSVLVGAFDGATLVGASTGTPLSDHADDFAAAFEGTGLDLSRIFYCAESVLLPEYRGQGIGHRFFDLREAHARAHGFSDCAFCSVIRDGARPADYRPLDAFWINRGYTKLPGVVARFSWRDLGETEESVKSLQFWHRKLDKTT